MANSHSQDNNVLIFDMKKNEYQSEDKPIEENKKEYHCKTEKCKCCTSFVFILLLKDIEIQEKEKEIAYYEKNFKQMKYLTKSFYRP